MPGAAEHAIKVFGETDQQVAGLNGVIRQTPVMTGGKRNKKNKSNKNKTTHGGKNKNKSNKNKSNKNNKSYKNKSNKNKTMRGGK